MLRRSPIWSDPRVKPPFGSVEIDRGHPLSVGLALVFLSNEGAGNPRDLVANLPVTARGAQTAPTWTPALGGIGHQNTTRWYATRPDIYNATDTSVMVVLDDRLNTGQPRTNIVSVWDGLDVDQKTFRLQLDDSELVLNGFALIFDLGRSQWANIRVAGLHAWGFRMNVTAAASTATRDGGAAVAATEVGGYLTAGNANTTPILGAPATSTGITHIASVVWTRLLSTDQMAWATTEPYAFLRPIIRRRYFVPVSISVDSRWPYTRKRRR